MSNKITERKGFEKIKLWRDEKKIEDEQLDEILKACDDVALPESGTYYQLQTNKIMQRIFLEERKKMRATRAKNFTKKLKRLHPVVQLVKFFTP